MKTVKSLRQAGIGLVLAMLLTAGSAAKGWAQAGSNDAQIQADVTKALDNKRFKDVQIGVQDGVEIGRAHV